MRLCAADERMLGRKVRGVQLEIRGLVRVLLRLYPLLRGPSAVVVGKLAMVLRSSGPEFMDFRSFLFSRDWGEGKRPVNASWRVTRARSALAVVAGR